MARSGRALFAGARPGTGGSLREARPGRIPRPTCRRIARRRASSRSSRRRKHNSRSAQHCSSGPARLRPRPPPRSRRTRTLQFQLGKTYYKQKKLPRGGGGARRRHRGGPAALSGLDLQGDESVSPRREGSRHRELSQVAGDPPALDGLLQPGQGLRGGRKVHRGGNRPAGLARRWSPRARRRTSAFCRRWRRCSAVARRMRPSPSSNRTSRASQTRRRHGRCWRRRGPHRSRASEADQRPSDGLASHEIPRNSTDRRLDRPPPKKGRRDV